MFVLLLHFKQKEFLGDDPIFMESPQSHGNSISIDATVQQHSPIVSGLLAVHAISGCDAVASYFGIGKIKALHVLRTGM